MGRGGHSGGGGRGGHSSFGGRRGGFSGGRGGRSNFAYTRYHSHFRRRYPGIVITNVYGYPSYRAYSKASSGIYTALILAFICLIIGGMFLGFGVQAINQANGSEAAKYSDAIYATCVSNEYEYSYPDSAFFYYSTYSYTVNGRQYEAKSKIGWDKPEEIGKSVKIRYLKSDPTYIIENEYYLEEIDGGNSKYIMLAIGIIALVVVVGSIIFAIVSASKAKKAEAALDKEVLASNAQQSNSNGSAQSGEVFDMNEFKKGATKKCEYCGSTYSAKLDKCPNCGASNN